MRQPRVKIVESLVAFRSELAASAPRNAELECQPEGQLKSVRLEPLVPGPSPEDNQIHGKHPSKGAATKSSVFKLSPQSAPSVREAYLDQESYPTADGDVQRCEAVPAGLGLLVRCSTEGHAYSIRVPSGSLAARCLALQEQRAPSTEHLLPRQKF